MARVPEFARHRRTIPPCKGCEKRRVGCHSVCDGYKGWQEQELKRKEEAYTLYNGRREADDYEIKRTVQCIKQKGR